MKRHHDSFVNNHGGDADADADGDGDGDNQCHKSFELQTCKHSLPPKKGKFIPCHEDFEFKLGCS